MLRCIGGYSSGKNKTLHELVEGHPVTEQFSCLCPSDTICEKNFEVGHSKQEAKANISHEDLNSPLPNKKGMIGIPGGVDSKGQKFNFFGFLEPIKTYPGDINYSDAITRQIKPFSEQIMELGKKPLYLSNIPNPTNAPDTNTPTPTTNTPTPSVPNTDITKQ